MLPREQWILIRIPELAIIPKGLFSSVQQRAKKNRERAKRNRKRDYLLAGFFRFGACHNAMAGPITGAGKYK